jgi:kynurenine formamidase
VEWQLAEVTSPHLAHPVSVVAAKDLPYLPNANRFQNLSIYLPETQKRPALSALRPVSFRPPTPFAATDPATPIIAVASLNYTLSPFPAHPALGYDAVQDNHSDPAREATHPEHLSDVLRGLALLRSFGLTDQSYILSGHSCGACIAFQAILQAPRHYGLVNLPDTPAQPRSSASTACMTSPGW